MMERPSELVTSNSDLAEPSFTFKITTMNCRNVEASSVLMSRLIVFRANQRTHRAHAHVHEVPLVTEFNEIDPVNKLTV